MGAGTVATVAGSGSREGAEAHTEAHRGHLAPWSSIGRAIGLGRVGTEVRSHPVAAWEARMKRVHLLAGAAALAPVALGMTAQAAANAAVTSGRPATSAVPAGARDVKPVFLRHSAATPDSSCVGDTEFTFGAGHVRGHGWYTRDGGKTCLGTVVLSLYFGKSFCKYGGISVVGLTAGSYHQSAYYCGAKGFWVPTDFGVHQYFAPLVSGQAWSTYEQTSIPTWRV
jgi:hypothetical protein